MEALTYLVRGSHSVSEGRAINAHWLSEMHIGVIEDVGDLYLDVAVSKP